MRIKDMKLIVKTITPITLIIVISLVVVAYIWINMIKEEAFNSIIDESRAITQQLENSRKFMVNLNKVKSFDPALLIEAKEAIRDAKDTDEVVKKLRETRFYNTIPIVASWTIGQEKAKGAHYEFRVTRIQARNKKNEANPIEREMLTEIKQNNLPELYRVDESINSLRFLKPITLNKGCLVCHGVPGVDYKDSIDGNDPIGFKMEGWKEGEVHGAFEIINSLTPLQEEINLIMLKIFIIGVVIVLIVGIVIYLVINPVVIKPIKNVQKAFDQIASGNLILETSENVGKDEIGKMISSMHDMVRKLREVIKNVLVSSEELTKSSINLVDSSKVMMDNSNSMTSKLSMIASSSEEVTTNVNTVASGAEETSINIGSITASVEELSANINTIAAATEEASTNMSGINSNVEQISKESQAVAGTVESVSLKMKEINSRTEDAKGISTEANEKAQKTLKIMEDLGESANKIGRIVKLVSNISSQTNMLSLNATIEASSAGEAGKGFTVVAGEIKELAKQSSSASNEITLQIEEIQKLVTESLNLTHDVTKVINGVAEINSSIGTTISEQSEAVVEIAKSTDSIANFSKSSVINVKEATQGVQEIARSASEASLASKDAARNVTEGATGVKEIARSSNEVSSAVTEVNKNLQEMQSAINEFNQGVNNTNENAESLRQIAGNLKQAVEYFDI